MRVGNEDIKTSWIGERGGWGVTIRILRWMGVGDKLWGRVIKENVFDEEINGSFIPIIRALGKMGIETGGEEGEGSSIRDAGSKRRAVVSVGVGDCSTSPPPRPRLRCL